MFAEVQVAGTAALNGSQECVKEIRKTYKERRDLLIKSFKRIAFFASAMQTSLAKKVTLLSILILFGIILNEVPLILSGGITPMNAKKAISIVNPYGLDVSSGVEKEPGIKDYNLIRDLVSIVKSV